MAATIKIFDTKATITDEMKWECEEAVIKGLLDTYLPDGGPSGADPNPPYTLALQMQKLFDAEILRFDPTTSDEIVK